MSPKPFDDLRRKIRADPVRRRRIDELTGRFLLLASLGRKRGEPSLPHIEGQRTERN